MPSSLDMDIPRYSAEAPEALADLLRDVGRRVLLFGPPGVGKSTLIAALARALPGCHVLGADPGTPLFGAPGAVCLGRWVEGGWETAAVEALCTLDAGRFRLPLVSAVARLAVEAPAGETLLVDAPGVVRGMAGAELLPALCRAAGIDLMLVFLREDGTPPLAAELAALPVEVVTVSAASVAQRPGKAGRGRARTALWDAWLAGAETRSLDLDGLAVVGTPLPRSAPEAWVGRQIALLAEGRTVAMGEALALVGERLQVRLPPGVKGDALLVRDAARDAAGFLSSAPPFAAEPLDYVPVAALPAGPAEGGPRVTGRVGNLDVSLVNGVFGDPLLHLRPRHLRRSLLFDLGAGARLSARLAHQVSDVFISHAHMDHLAGFLWLLRSRIDELPACRVYGPPGLAGHIAGLVRGFLWDRVAERAPRFEVMELHGGSLRCFSIVAGRDGMETLPDRPAPDGELLSEAGFRVRAAALDHAGTPVLAFAFEPDAQLNVRKDRLRARGLSPGPWLGVLKANLQAGRDDAPVSLPDGSRVGTAELAAELVLVSPGKRLVYATDLGDTPANRAALVALARGAHTLFLEACFREADAAQAARTGHLTTRACGEIAVAAEVTRLVPFHFSGRYEDEPAQVYAEIAAVCPALVMPSAWVVDAEGS